MHALLATPHIFLLKKAAPLKEFRFCCMTPTSAQRNGRAFYSDSSNRNDSSSHSESDGSDDSDVDMERIRQLAAASQEQAEREGTQPRRKKLGCACCDADICEEVVDRMLRDAEEIFGAEVCVDASAGTQESTLLSDQKDHMVGSDGEGVRGGGAAETTNTATKAAATAAAAVGAAAAAPAAAGDMAGGDAPAPPATAAAAVPSTRGTARSRAAKWTVDLGAGGGGVF